jgi:regulator of protease activity HflC (stomatin/prohibitin superfamily)
MDTLTEPEIEGIVQRLETFVTALEHDLSTPTFYAFVLLAQEFAVAKKVRYTLAHIRRCLTLAHRMRPIRDRLVSAGGRWIPLHEVGEVIQAEATRLSSLYGVARPACRTQRRELQQAFRTAFTQATGKTYQKYGLSLTTKESATITAWWDEALRTALARFQSSGEGEALDQVMACLPVWADRHHERWSRQGWREPSATEVTHLFEDYLRVCEACLGTVAQLVSTAVAHIPVVDPAEVTRDVEPQYTEQVRALRARLSALPLPKDTPKAQHAQLRKERTQLQHELQALLKAQEAEITRRIKQGAHARHKLDTLVKTASGYTDSLFSKVGKASVDVLPRMLWIYELDRQGDADWRMAKREAKRFVRQLRQGSATPVAVEAQ